MEEITLGQLLQAVNGTLLGPFQNPSAIIQKVDTDSRNMHPGSLFIPLVGDRFDGHAYINAALESGAVGCLTARERESYREDKFYVKVANTQRALRDLAAFGNCFRTREEAQAAADKVRELLAGLRRPEGRP